jgi:predicted thioredoxin/glutaredoxin
MLKNNIIKIVGADNCKDCNILFNLVNDYVQQKKMNIKIEKIHSISDEAIDLSINFNINTVPFAIFNDNKIIFNRNITISDIKDFLK